MLPVLGYGRATVQHGFLHEFFRKRKIKELVVEMVRRCPECVAVLAAVAALALLISGMAGLVWLSSWLAA